jgi:hypothetical protein
MGICFFYVMQADTFHTNTIGATHPNSVGIPLLWLVRLKLQPNGATLPRYGKDRR